jgi:glucosamine 6-phosphate synthetase-like amidotransferase/phosphosugar isomerase protein
MCGIVGAVAQRNVVPILIEGLKKLEYRGYDSAGIAIVNGAMSRVRAVGRVADLEARTREQQSDAPTGIAHTRWATHGGVTETNAHPHYSDGAGMQVSVVHNGIIENHEALRAELRERGYVFQSETDTEVIAHLVHSLVGEGAPPARRVRDRGGQHRRAPHRRRLAPRLAAAARRRPRGQRARRELPRLRHLRAAAGHQARDLPRGR